MGNCNECPALEHSLAQAVEAQKRSALEMTKMREDNERMNQQNQKRIVELNATATRLMQELQAARAHSVQQEAKFVEEMKKQQESHKGTLERNQREHQEQQDKAIQENDDKLKQRDEENMRKIEEMNKLHE